MSTRSPIGSAIGRLNRGRGCDGALALKPQVLYNVINIASPWPVMECIPKRQCNNYVCDIILVKGERTETLNS